MKVALVLLILVGVGFVVMTYTKSGIDEGFELPFGPGASALARLAAADKVMSVQEITLFPEWQAVPAAERAKIIDTDTKLFVPVMSQGTLVAVILLGPQPERPYSQEEVDLLRAVANQAAIKASCRVRTYLTCAQYKLSSCTQCAIAAWRTLPSPRT